MDRPRTDKSGTKWNFRVWHDVFTLQRVHSAARVFFWDKKQDFTGVVLLGPETYTHIHRIRNVMEKLLADPKLRAKHRRHLRFPLERHYAEYGAFPEELETLENLQRPK